MDPALLRGGAGTLRFRFTGEKPFPPSQIVVVIVAIVYFYLPRPWQLATVAPWACPRPAACVRWPSYSLLPLRTSRAGPSSRNLVLPHQLFFVYIFSSFVVIWMRWTFSHTHAHSFCPCVRVNLVNPLFVTWFYFHQERRHSRSKYPMAIYASQLNCTRMVKWSCRRCLRNWTYPWNGRNTLYKTVKLSTKEILL